MLKRVGAAAATAACALTLTGCTVAPGGIVGVTIDAQGNPLIVVQMCEGHIDGATLYLEGPESDNPLLPPKDKTMGRWEVTPAVTGFSQFALDTGGNGWRLVSTLEPRDPATRYTIYGWSNDDSWMAEHLDFSQQELAGLRPGAVRVPAEEEGNRTESLADFQKKTCENWGS